MKMILILILSILPTISWGFDLKCEITKTYTGEHVQTLYATDDSMIAFDLGYAKFLWANYNNDPKEAPVGFYAIIFGDGTFNSSFGNKADQYFSLIDNGLGYKIECLARE